MIAQFISRPLFACVISAFIVIAGLMSLRGLSIGLYPDILPPTIEISTMYPGATPEVSADTVAAPLEQQINGAEGMIYMRSASTPTGVVNIVATFAVGFDADKAVIDVQNRVQAALPLLPEDVRRQGVVVRKLSWTAVAYVTIDAPSGQYDESYISNYALVNVIDEIRRLPGVQAVDTYGGKEHSIRIWLFPDKLAQAGLTPMDVAKAVREQNSQYATGRIGQAPMVEVTDNTMSITAQGRLSDPEGFRRIILKAEPSGQIIRLGDVSRVELGARDYTITTTQDGKPAFSFGVFPQHGADVVKLSDAIHETMTRLATKFPAGLHWKIPFDTSDFVRVAIQEVLKTLVEATVLVFIVVYLFLRDWRATVIPCLTVPVSLTGALAGMYVLGATINLATLFAMVLSIGIVVDDAIVVLENVERHMRTNGLSAPNATRVAMKEVTGPLIAIVLVLSAVFIPIAFLGGLVGEVYRQFAITISVSVIVSGFIALTLTPALCAALLKPIEHKPAAPAVGVLARVPEWFETLTAKYTRGATYFLEHQKHAAVIVGVMLVATAGLLYVIPKALIPEEDQGYIIGLPFLPPAASQQRTDAVMKQLDERFTNDPAVYSTLSFGGLDPYTSQPRTGAGVSFINFIPWSKRGKKSMQAPAMLIAMAELNDKIKDALVVGAPPPPIEGLSATGGFEGFVQSRVGADYQALEAATARLVAAAATRPELAGVFSSFTAHVPQLRFDVDRDQAKLLGVDIDDLFTTLQSTFGAYYVNDFNLRGRVYKVQMQADANYRTHAEDLRNVYVRSRNGRPIPITALGKTSLVTGPDMVERFNVFPSARVLGEPAPGYSSGQAIDAMDKLVRDTLPEGYTFQWSSQAFLEKQASASTAGLYLLAMLMVFLILAAQYERLMLPLAVILSIPFAVFGAVAATTLRGLQNDLYMQIGLVTLIGLSAKNAVLVVEFAAQRVKAGADVMTAAVEAAQLRFRPIVMTSLAFILGVLPLAVSSGAGANARHSMATGVIGGMLAATFVATLFTPLFFSWTHHMGNAARVWLARRYAASGPGE